MAFRIRDAMTGKRVPRASLQGSANHISASSFMRNLEKACFARGVRPLVPLKDRRKNRCRVVGVTLVALFDNRATKVTPTASTSDSY